MAVGRAVLPEASEKALKALALYAQASDRYLAAVDSIAKRAKYIAQLEGRPNCTTGDIHTAMKESVIPSDTMLACNLEKAKKSSRYSTRPEPIPSIQTTVEPPAPTRQSWHTTLPEPISDRIANRAPGLVKV